MRHAQQIQRLCHPWLILARFKNVQRLLVCMYTFGGSSSVHVPVRQPIETMSLQWWISNRLCKCASLLEPLSGLGIIAPCPQRTEQHHTSPFHLAILVALRLCGCPLIIALRPL